MSCINFNCIKPGSGLNSHADNDRGSIGDISQKQQTTYKDRDPVETEHRSLSLSLSVCGWLGVCETQRWLISIVTALTELTSLSAAVYESTDTRYFPHVTVCCCHRLTPCHVMQSLKAFLEGSEAFHRHTHWRGMWEILETFDSF